MASFLSVVFLARCRIRILLLFSASTSFQLCLLSVALLCYLCLPSFLSLSSLLFSTPVSLASVPFDWFVCFGTSCLLSSLVFGFLPLFLLDRFFLSSVYWPCVVLVHLLHNSVTSQFLRDGVLPLGRVISYGFSWGGSGLVHLCPLVIRPLRFWSMILFLSASALGWEFFPKLRFATLGFLSFSLLEFSAFPYGLAFFLFVHCCCLSPFRFCPLSPLPVSVLIYLVYGAVAVCFILFFLVYKLFYYWRRAPSKFPLSSHCASASVLLAALGRCTWLRQLSPLVRCVHGDSIGSSKPQWTLLLAPTSMPTVLLNENLW